MGGSGIRLKAAGRRVRSSAVRPRAASDFSSVHWERIVGPLRADPMREAILRALQSAYDENCRRHAPDDLGDNNLTFGVAVSQNLRFLLERELHDFPSIEIVRPRGSFAVLIDGKFELYFYKAPPGVFDIRALRLDASRTQIELVDANTNQLSLFDPEPQGEPEELRRLACIHFGDPLEGLHRADVGAPHNSTDGGLQWEWAECLSTGEELLDAGPTAENLRDVEEEDDDFDLRLRSDEGDSDMTDESSA